MTKTRVAIIGCGNIAGPYSKDILKHPSLEIAGFSDIDQARAQAFATEHGGKAYANLEEALADPSVDADIETFLTEASSFPASPNDDEVDAMTQYINWSRKRSKTTGLQDFYREQAEELKRAREAA